MTMRRVNPNLLFPKLSYEIVGACFDAWNEVGPAHREAFVQKSVAAHLRARGLRFREQVRCNLVSAQVKIGYYCLDFLVEDSIVLELKVGGRFRKQDYEQIKTYLRSANISLGILVRFGDDGVTFHRVLRPFTRIA